MGALLHSRGWQLSFKTFILHIARAAATRLQNLGHMFALHCCKLVACVLPTIHSAKGSPIFTAKRYMQIPVDENGLEWWEKLPIEKQDRFPLPPPTPESIEDIHWQLIVELDQKALEAAVKDSGKLPGEHCGCKACRVHKSKLPQPWDGGSFAS